MNQAILGKKIFTLQNVKFFYILKQQILNFQTNNILAFLFFCRLHFFKFSPVAVAKWRHSNNPAILGRCVSNGYNTFLIKKKDSMINYLSSQLPDVIILIKYLMIRYQWRNTGQDNTKFQSRFQTTTKKIPQNEQLPYSDHDFFLLNFQNCSSSVRRRNWNQ